MEKENQRVALTKRMLKKGLLELLNSTSLEKISVTELCRMSGINRATFYRHYEFPRDILIEIEKELLRELRQTVGTPATAEETRVAMEAFCTFLNDHAPLLRIIIQNNSDTEFAQLLADMYQESCTGLCALKPFQSMDPEDMKILTTCWAGSGYFILRQWLLGNISKTPQQIAAIAYKFLCNIDWQEMSTRLGLTT